MFLFFTNLIRNRVTPCSGLNVRSVSKEGHLALVTLIITFSGLGYWLARSKKSRLRVPEARLTSCIEVVRDASREVR